MDTIYSLRDAGLYVDGRFILQDMSWDVPAQSVSVVFGAGGAGKTSLLRALTGLRGPPVVPSGAWSYLGRDLFEAGRSLLLLPKVAWCAQPPRGWQRTPGGDWGPGLRRALGGKESHVLLLDEPNAWVDESGCARLIETIRARAVDATIVVSTHDIEFGRSCGDRACLLGEGRILAAGDASTFFSSSSPSIRHFLRSGSFQAGAAGPPAPPSLHWVLDRQLAGMAQPGLIRPLEDDLAYMQARGVTALVTLTEEPLADEARKRLLSHGVQTLLHSPIRDMGVPSVARAAMLSRELARLLADGQVVVVHCRGGVGRTGVVLALVLMTQGLPASAAIEFVRSIQPRYIQTDGQEAFVRLMESWLLDDRAQEGRAANVEWEHGA